MFLVGGSSEIFSLKALKWYSAVLRLSGYKFYHKIILFIPPYPYTALNILVYH